MSKNNLIQDFDFARHLKRRTSDYDGDYSEVLQLTSEIFYLCTIMVYNKDISQNQKNMLYKSIAYFLLPHDVFSENVHGVKGYLDDVDLSEIKKFEKDIIDKIKSEKSEIINEIQSSGKLEENNEKLLTQIIDEYKKGKK